MIDWRQFNSGEKDRSSQKNITFVLDRKFRHFPNLPVLRDFLCIEPKGLSTSYKKISIVTKWASGASRKNTIKFHLMWVIAFYSPCFCLSNRVWHEQIVSCTIVTDPNKFKCHGTIFTFLTPKNALLSWANSLKPNSSNARCHPLLWGCHNSNPNIDRQVTWLVED